MTGELDKMNLNKTSRVDTVSDARDAFTNQLIFKYNRTTGDYYDKHKHWKLVQNKYVPN